MNDIHLELRDPSPKRVIDIAPPVRVVAIISLCAVILDLLADILLCIRFGQVKHRFESETAVRAVYAFFFFTAVSCVTFIIELIDIVLTLKNNQENRILTPLAKSLGLVLEEIPLPVCLLIILTNEPRTMLANPAMLASCIKLIALIWGIVKFIKFRFCWFFLPCILDHGLKENVRRCFNFKPMRILMLFVNVCHAIAIILVIVNIIHANQIGSRAIVYRGE